MTINTESRSALRELIDLLEEIDQRWAGPEWNLHSEDDVAAAHRSLMHVLEGGLATMFESDAAYPRFRRIVTPQRKFTGDNSDAIYFDTPVSPDFQYEVKGSEPRCLCVDHRRGGHRRRQHGQPNGGRNQRYPVRCGCRRQLHPARGWRARRAQLAAVAGGRLAADHPALF